MIGSKVERTDARVGPITVKAIRNAVTAITVDMSATPATASHPAPDEGNPGVPTAFNSPNTTAAAAIMTADPAIGDADRSRYVPARM